MPAYLCMRFRIQIKLLVNSLVYFQEIHCAAGRNRQRGNSPCQSMSTIMASTTTISRQERGRERGRAEFVEWAQLTERLMQTKWQHLTPDECAANKSIYAKHLLIIIIRYAAHTHTPIQTCISTEHTHSVSYTHTVNI